MSSLRIGMLLSHVRTEEKQLIAAFNERGIDPIRLLDRTLTFDLTGVQNGYPDQLDIVLDRCMAHGRAAMALQVFDAYGVPTINDCRSAAAADDKAVTTMMLAKAGVPTIRSAVAFDTESALEVLEEIGYPAVIKPVTGSWGRLLAKVNSPEAARSLIEHKRALGTYHHGVLYIQEYIEKPGRDLRIFVIDDEIIAASYRSAEHWVTNVAKGATSQPCPVTDEIYDISMRAVRAIGVEIAGVDLVETPDGLQVIEVNTGAEFKGLMTTTHVDIAGEIAAYVIERAEQMRDLVGAGSNGHRQIHGHAFP